MSANDSGPNSNDQFSVDETLDYDPTAETYHARFDPEAHPDIPVVAAVETVAAVTDRDVLHLSPLFEAIHPGALNEIVTSSRNGTLEVSFEYEGCAVTVSSSGGVVVSVAE